MESVISPPRLDRARAALLLVDFQQRLLPAMHDGPGALANAVRLARAATLLGLPVFVTEQYPSGLGPTVPPLDEVLGSAERWEKNSFSAAAVEPLRARLRQRGQVLLAGIESHVCVCQTGLDLLAGGIETFVVADAVTSRSQENARLGVERLRAAGASVVSTEMALFELLVTASAPEFKAIQALIK